jgi:hypothetical protein
MAFFKVKALHLEPGVVAEVKAILQAHTAWHKTPQVVRYATKPGLAKWLSD